MKLTDEQLAEIADKGALAAYVVQRQTYDDPTNQDTLYLTKGLTWNQEYAARQTFARTVIAAALSKMAEGEGDLVTADEIKDNWHLTGGWNDVLSDSINTRHRQAMAALRAQMQSKIDQAEKEAEEHCQTGFRITKLNGEILVDRDQWKARAEKAEAEVVELRVRDGRWFDKDGCCRVCDGELPHGHTESCDIFKTGQEITVLKQAPAGREAFERWWSGYCTFPNEGYGPEIKKDHMAEAFKAGQQAALAHKPQPWIPCSERPRIVCLCGSSKFPEAHMKVIMEETLAGRIVVPMGLYGHADFPAGARAATNDGDEATEVKQMLDRLHFAKIDLADEILVVNVGGYVGSSTKREIAHAEANGKQVRYLEPTAPTAEKVPTPPEGFHLASEEERKCLPVGYQAWDGTFQRWVTVDLLEVDRTGRNGFSGSIYACPNTPPLVSFTNGKINPPPYGSWHRSDWSPEMLPDGWRPLLLGESEWPDDEHYDAWKNSWLLSKDFHPSIPLGGADKTWVPHRTRRPLPPAPEKEKEPEWVPLEACDVPPGSVFRQEVRESEHWHKALMVTPKGAVVTGIDQGSIFPQLWTFQMLFNGCAEISRDNGKTWEACKKIKQS